MLRTVRNGLFWMLCLSVALVSYRVLFVSAEVVMPVVVQHYVRPVALFGHILFAPVALALLPFQFWDRFRRERRGVHRILGRVYAGAVLVSGLSGLWLAFTTESGVLAAWGFGLLAVIWLGVTAKAVMLARARNIAQHKIWMVRSAALTFAAVTLRLQLPIGLGVWGFEISYPIISWTCWVPNLIFVEMWLRRKDFLRVA